MLQWFRIKNSRFRNPKTRTRVRYEKRIQTLYPNRNTNVFGFVERTRIRGWTWTNFVTQKIIIPNVFQWKYDPNTNPNSDSNSKPNFNPDRIRIQIFSKSDMKIVCFNSLPTNNDSYVGSVFKRRSETGSESNGAIHEHTASAPRAPRERPETLTI